MKNILRLIISLFFCLQIVGCVILEKVDEIGVAVLEELVPDETTVAKTNIYGTPSNFPLSATNLKELSGDDHLFLLHPKYDAAGAGKQHKAGEALGILDFTPSDSIANLRTFFNYADVGIIRVHIINNTCIRNKNCGKYEIGYGYSLNSWNAAILKKEPKILNFLKQRVGIYKQWRNIEQPYLPICISPSLEHNNTAPAWRVLADTVKEVWPEVQLCNSPSAGVSAERYRGAWIERHGKSPAADSDIISTDGVEIMDIDSVKYITQKAGTKIKFRWSRRNNCRDQGPFKDPRKRTNCLNEREAEQQVHVTDIIGKAKPKTFKCKRYSFNKDNIWKPLSEDHGSGDPRANFPVIIPKHLPHKDLDIYAYNGKKAGTMGYYGKFSDGRPRSYSNYPDGSKFTGYEFQKKAKQISGSPYTWAVKDGICVGPFLGGRRQGDYR